MCLKQPLFTKNEFVEAYVIFSLFSKFFNSATSIFSTLVMSWSFSNSAVTRVCMFKFSALYLQWFQSYGQQFIWLLDVDCLADKERLKLLLSGEGSFILPPFTQLVPPPHRGTRVEKCPSRVGKMSIQFETKMIHNILTRWNWKLIFSEKRHTGERVFWKAHS